MKYHLLALLLVAPALLGNGCKEAQKRLEAERRKECPESAPRLRAIPVDLPKAATGAPVERVTALVTVTAQGRFYLNGLETTERDLARKLLSIRAEKGRVDVVVSADRSARHGDVVRAIDAARLAGIRRYAVQILDTSAPKPLRP